MDSGFDDLLLITGHMRSGTSLLRRICNSHTKISVAHELGCFHGLGKTGIENAFIGARAAWQKLRRARGFSPGSLTAFRYALDVSGHPFLKMDPGRLKGILSRTLPSARYLGDKKPSYIFALERFVRIREISIVIVYRDCRDVVAANLMRVRAQRRPSRHQHRFDTADKIAARWVDCISLMEQHADAVLSVRYEELARSPMGELGRVADRLSLNCGDFDESIINTVHTRDIGLYENYLTPAELATIKEIAGSTMDQRGYTVK